MAFLNLSRISSLLLVGVLVTACTNSTDPTQINAADLLFGRPRLRQHLDERWIVLDSLRGQARRLDSRVQAQLSRLRAAERDLADAAQIEGVSAADRRKAEEALARKQEEGEYIDNRIRKAQGEINRLDSDVRDAEIAKHAAEARAAAIERENAKISREIEIYEASNAQTIRLSQQALRRR
jgi:hypothetical protein